MDSLKRKWYQNKAHCQTARIRKTALYITEYWWQYYPNHRRQATYKPNPQVWDRRKGNDSHLKAAIHIVQLSHHRVKLRQNQANLSKAEKHLDTALKHGPRCMAKATPALKDARLYSKQQGPWQILS